MKDKEKQFKERIACGIAYCEDTPSKQKEIEEILEKVGIRYGMDVRGISYVVNAHNLTPYLQPKIDKDSVVLSREEYEKLKTDNEVLGVELERTSTLLVNARKETAEKIFKMLISELESNKFLYGKRIIMEVDVENLAKQCGVEVKE